MEESGTSTYYSASQLKNKKKEILKKIADNYEKIDVISLVAFTLETGKKHQIRYHCEEKLGVSILYDFKYGFRFENIKTQNFSDLVVNYGPELKEYFDNKGEDGTMNR